MVVNPERHDGQQDAEVTYRRDGRIAFITFNRPDRLNALTDEMESELAGALDRFDTDEDAWVAVVHGEGRAFSAGADVKRRFQAGVEAQDPGRRLHTQVRGRPSEGWLGRTENWKPVIAAVHGYCLGFGMALALESDLLVAAQGTTFGISETKRGVAGGRVWARLQTFMPSKLATEMLLFGEPIDAAELYRLGAINRLVPEGQHLQAATDMAERLLSVPPLAVRAGVRVSRRAWLLPVAEADYYVQPLRLHRSQDYAESVQAFVEKRQPKYTAK